MNTIEFSDHILICNFAGLEKTTEMIREIQQDESTKNTPIVIIDDSLKELPSELESDQIFFVKGSPMRLQTLKNANVESCRAAVIQADPSDPEGTDNANLRIALTIETISSDVYTCVECLNPDNAIFFKHAKCDSVVCIASLSGQMVVQELQDPGVSAVVTELTSNKQGRQFYITEINSDAVDFQSLQTQFTGKESVLIGVRRNGENILVPAPDFALEADDQAILIAASRPV